MSNSYNKKIRVLDITTTDIAAYRLLKSRVSKINGLGCFRNAIACPSGPYADAMKSEGIEVLPIEINRELDLLRAREELNSLRSVIKQFDPHIVHTHNSKAGVLGRIAAKREHVPVTIHQVHGFFFSSLSGTKRKIYEIIEKHSSKRADYILFQNMDEYNYAKKGKWNTTASLEYIGNGIPISGFSELQRNPSSDQKKCIVCIARVEPVKNHIYLLEGLAIMAERYPKIDFTLHLIGEYDDNGKRKILDSLQNADLTDRVVLEGAVSRERILGFLEKADLSVLTSLKEGKPRALIESSMAGVPVIGTDVIGTREVVRDGYNGYLVPLNEPQILAEKMHDVLSNSSLAERLGSNGRKFALEEFDEEKVIERIVEIYKAGVARCPKKSQ